MNAKKQLLLYLVTIGLCMHGAFISAEQIEYKEAKKEITTNKTNISDAINNMWSSKDAKAWKNITSDKG